MDSLTQIILGAAVGEVVLGKKAGNRAMFYGGVGGTIPDLDVLSNFFMDEMSALAFHRSISHSFFFAALAPIALGWLTWKLYDSGLYQRQGYKLFAMLIWILLFGLIAFGLSYLPVMAGAEPSKTTMIAGAVLTVVLALWLYRRYFKSPLDAVPVSWKEWGFLYFWAIFTHPLLDCCTAYGTQVFQPFSDYRVAFNNISVVDPIYTLPFLICLIVASRLVKRSRYRRFFNYLGLGLSGGYLLLTVLNKMNINKVMERSMQEQGIQYHRYMTAPTIFNNILWNCLAEGDTAYYQGMYSIWDREPRIQHFNVIPKNHNWLGEHAHDKDVEILKWFSNGYYNVVQQEDGSFQINDLRFGALSDRIDKPSDYVFRFKIKEVDGQWKASQNREQEGSVGDAFKTLWERIKGI